MSGEEEWRDPFHEDDAAARERERRRAEREARRRERAARASLGARAQETEAAGEDRAGRDRGREEPSQGPSEEPRASEAEGDEPPGDRGWRGSATPSGGGGPSGGSTGRWRIRARRVVAIVGVLAAAAAVVFAVGAVSDRLGGRETPQPTRRAAPVTKVTIPEGLSRRQIAGIARDAGLRGNYMKATRSAKGFKTRRYGVADPESLEGFLFPATYEVSKRAHVSELVSRQLDAFRERIAGVDMGYARSKNLTVYDVLIIASMIEREVQVPEERRKVAEVLYNRLSQGIPLGIDATIRYEDANFTEPLLESRLHEDTPYNTRTKAGLPPGPIGNPGLASVKAAADPGRGDLLYYVVEPGTCGEHVFTSSAAEFEQAVAEYNRARESAGGKAPTAENC